MLHIRLIGILGILLAAFCAPRAVAQNCASGVSIGQITLPSPPGTLGLLEGELILGHTGPTLYRLSATLTELVPTPTGMRRGTIDGILYTSNAADYIVQGRWFASPIGQGYFRCVVIELGPNGKRVGRVGGSFGPPPGPLSYSPFQGSWLVCP